MSYTLTEKEREKVDTAPMNHAESQPMKIREWEHILTQVELAHKDSPPESFARLVSLLPLGGWMLWHVIDNLSGKNELEASVGNAPMAKITSNRKMAELLAKIEA